MKSSNHKTPFSNDVKKKPIDLVLPIFRQNSTCSCDFHRCSMELIAHLDPILVSDSSYNP